MADSFRRIFLVILNRLFKMSKTADAEVGKLGSSAGSAAAASVKVDRAATCPMLLRAFVAPAHHPPAAYDRGRTPAATEVAVYCWSDTSLREIAALVLEKHEPARRRGARLSFALVYPDRTGRFTSKHAGMVSLGKDGHALSSAASSACAAAHVSGADLTVGSLKVQAGDYFDIAVM